MKLSSICEQAEVKNAISDFLKQCHTSYPQCHAQDAQQFFSLRDETTTSSDVVIHDQQLDGHQIFETAINENTKQPVTRQPEDISRGQNLQNDNNDNKNNDDNNDSVEYISAAFNTEKATANSTQQAGFREPVLQHAKETLTCCCLQPVSRPPRPSLSLCMSVSIELPKLQVGIQHSEAMDDVSTTGDEKAVVTTADREDEQECRERQQDEITATTMDSFSNVPKCWNEQHQHQEEEQYDQSVQRIHLQEIASRSSSESVLPFQPSRRVSPSTPEELEHKCLTRPSQYAGRLFDAPKPGGQQLEGLVPLIYNPIPPSNYFAPPYHHPFPLLLQPPPLLESTQYRRYWSQSSQRSASQSCFNAMNKNNLPLGTHTQNSYQTHHMTVAQYPWLMNAPPFLPSMTTDNPHECVHPTQSSQRRQTHKQSKHSPLCGFMSPAWCTD